MGVLQGCVLSLVILMTIAGSRATTRPFTVTSSSDKSTLNVRVERDPDEGDCTAINEYNESDDKCYFFIKVSATDGTGQVQEERVHYTTTDATPFSVDKNKQYRVEVCRTNHVDGVDQAGEKTRDCHQNYCLCGTCQPHYTVGGTC